MTKVPKITLVVAAGILLLGLTALAADGDGNAEAGVVVCFDFYKQCTNECEGEVHVKLH